MTAQVNSKPYGEKLWDNRAIEEFNRFTAKYEELSSKVSGLLASFGEVIRLSEDLDRASNSILNKQTRISSHFKTKLLHTTLMVAFSQIRKVFNSSQLKFSTDKELVYNAIISRSNRMFD